MSGSRFVVVVGCGRMGRALAERESGSGASVVVVDAEPEALAALSPEFSGFALVGDASELGTLKRAKVADADLLVAATGSDPLNFWCAKAARDLFSVPRAIARVGDPELEGFCRDIGLEAFCPIQAGVEGMLKAAAGGGRTS